MSPRQLEETSSWSLLTTFLIRGSNISAVQENWIHPSNAPSSQNWACRIHDCSSYDMCLPSGCDGLDMRKNAVLIKKYGCFFEDVHGPQVFRVSTNLGSSEEDHAGQRHILYYDTTFRNYGWNLSDLSCALSADEICDFCRHHLPAVSTILHKLSCSS